MAVCSCTFSCTIFVLLVTLCIVFMYNLTVIATCKEKSDSYWCLKPEYFMKTKMQLMVYVSTQEKSSWMTQHKLIFNETDFMRNETILRELNVTIPQSTLNNGTLYAHIFVGPQNKSPEKISNHDKFTIITAPLTKYLIPFAAEFNLATGEYESTVINTSSSPVSHWIPVLDILGVGEDWYLLPDEILLKSHSIKVDPGKLTYLPIIKCDHMKVLNRQLQRITVDNTTLPVTITYSPVGLGQLRVWINFQQTWTVFNTLGLKEDILKELVFNNFYLMMLTFLLGFIQMLFDFLAFINDISFWRKMKTTYGLSRRTVFWNCFILPVIFLYLMEVEETLLILVPHGISTIIVYWKLWKVLKVKVKWIHRLPRLEFGRQLASEQQTDFYDSQSMKQFHNYILIPLVIGGGIYSLMYLSYYKSVYSCVIHSVANGLYAFGFLFMLPQLFVNYKLKSVAHLPWRAFMYKALCTFTDDVLVFTISMPTSYRVAVFRDDLVFLVYLYQRWLYSVDKKTVKKYRKTFKDAVLKEKQN